MFNIAACRLQNLPQNQYLSASAEIHKHATGSGNQEDSEKTPSKQRWYFPSIELCEFDVIFVETDPIAVINSGIGYSL